MKGLISWLHDGECWLKVACPFPIKMLFHTFSIKRGKSERKCKWRAGSVGWTVLQTIFSVVPEIPKMSHMPLFQLAASVVTKSTMRDVFSAINDCFNDDTCKQLGLYVAPRCKNTKHLVPGTFEWL